MKAITYYKDFYGISYPLKKYDCIGLADFAMGAMENWGLVTFRETAVLVDPASTSAGTKQWVAIVVNHEMAHQVWSLTQFYSVDFSHRCKQVCDKQSHNRGLHPAFLKPPWDLCLPDCVFVSP